MVHHYTESVVDGCLVVVRPNVSRQFSLGPGLCAEFVAPPGNWVGVVPEGGPSNRLRQRSNVLDRDVDRTVTELVAEVRSNSTTIDQDTQP